MVARCATSSSTAAGSSARPARGRELYLAGAHPRRRRSSTSTTTCPTSRWRTPGAIRCPRPSASPRPRSRAGSARACFVVAYGSLGGAERLWWLLRHFGHDDCAVLIGGIDAWGGRAARRATRTIEPAEFVPRARDGRHRRRRTSSRAASAIRALVLVDARTAGPLARRAEPDRRPARPHPRRAQRAVGGPAAGAAGRRARRLLRLGCHRRASSCTARALAGRDGKLYPGLVERVVAARPADRARLTGAA